MLRLPNVTLSGLEISDLFFNYPNPVNNTIEQQAEDFLNQTPSFKDAGITVEMLIEDYKSRL